MSGLDIRASRLYVSGRDVDTPERTGPFLNLCRDCGEDFSSVEMFDRHRVGRHGYTITEGLHMDPPVEDGRRCLSPFELLVLGCELDARGRWHDPARSGRARRFEEAA